MRELINKIKELGWQRIAFSLVVLIYVGFLGFINIMMLLPNNFISAMGHFGFLYTGNTHNLIHELVFALIVGTTAVGLLSQLWKPKENLTGQLVALIAWCAMVLTAILTNNWVPSILILIFGGLTLIATILHPAGRGLFNWFSASRINRALLILVVVVAVPLFSFILTNISLQRAGNNMNQGESGEFFNLLGHKIPKHGNSGTSMPADIEAVKEKYANYTVAQAEREGYILDKFCLDAGSFDQPAERGAMGYHTTNEALLRGPIVAERPQAFMFDAEDRILGVEYEIVADAVSGPPQLFGQTFTKLPPHPGVAHEHYALHVWFSDNPNGQFADFNPKVSCPSSTTSPLEQTPSHGDMDNEGAMATNNKAHDQEHTAMGHYRNMAALSFIIILVGLLASFNPCGSRLAVWVAGLLPILLGLSSVVLPGAESSLGMAWSIAAITWGIVFITVAEVVGHKN